MTAYIYDPVRTPRGKARSDGGSAKGPPARADRQLAAGIDARVGSTNKTEALIRGCVGQIRAQGGNITLISHLHAGLTDAAAAATLVERLR